MSPMPPDSAAEQDPAAAASSTDARIASRRLRRPASWVALGVVTVALAGAFGWGWFNLSRDLAAVRLDSAQRLANAEAALQRSRAREAELAGDLRDVQAKLALLQARLAESQSQQAALEALYRELAPSRDELALTEVEQILTLASQQLALAGNVQAALTALQLADAKLARLDRPNFLPLRRSLARDMDALKAVPYVDVAGLSLRLDQAIAQVDGLPLARDERIEPPPRPAPAANESAWTRFLRDLWVDLRSVIRIEVSGRPQPPLLMPQEAFFLRENLRLRLLGARLSLLSRDQASYKSDLDDALQWLNRYFDIRSKPVASMVSSLAQARDVPMPTEMPDLGITLDTVRTLRATAEHASDKAGDRAAPPGSAASRPR